MTDRGRTDTKVKMPSASHGQNKEALLEVQKRTGQGVSATLEEWCEVAFYYLENLQRSVVFITDGATRGEVGGT